MRGVQSKLSGADAASSGRLYDHMDARTWVGAMNTTIPEDVMRAAREIVADTYDNGDYAEAARMVRDGNGDGMISVQIAARVILQEREECALIAEGEAHADCGVAEQIAAAIRRGGHDG